MFEAAESLHSLALAGRQPGWLDCLPQTLGKGTGEEMGQSYRIRNPGLIAGPGLCTSTATMDVLSLRMWA